jgi:DNA-binding PadR family transcriptional regulator
LTPTSYLVLGCLASGGPSTPYELKQAVAESVGYFWSFPHSQLYSEPARMTEAGLVKEEREEGGRRRRVFSITDAGRAALDDWLRQPTVGLPDIRDVGLLKLFFSDLASRDQILALAQAQRDAHEERLKLYEGLAAGPPQSAAESTIGLGIAWERAAAAFWSSIAEHPPKV